MVGIQQDRTALPPFAGRPSISTDPFDLDDVGSAAAYLTQTALTGAREIVGVALDALPMRLLFHSSQGILYANAEAGDLFGVAPSALVGQHLLDLVGPQDTEYLSDTLQMALGALEHETSAEVLLRYGNSERLCRLTLVRLPWQGNPIAQLVINDITDQRRAETSLRQLTITDELTGAYNRRHALYEGSLYSEAYQLDGTPFSVAAIDIDHFKKVNDTFGHAGGDRVLQALSSSCHAFLPTIREANPAMFARIGGEEFVLLFPGLAIQSASAECERLRRQIELMDVSLGAQTLGITISIGVSSMAASDQRFEDLLLRADSALYLAMHRGRNRVELAQPC